MVKPGGFVLPAWGELEGKMAFPHWVCFLEIPDVLQEERLLLHFVLVSDNVPRI
jgi:hypothetical protein